jgi:predicted P-loop ATPase
VSPTPSWLEDYVKRNFRLVFYPQKLKGPREEGWTFKPYPPESYQAGQNVGVMLGTEVAPGRFLVDLDFDWAEGVPMAKRLLPATGFGFGRASRPISHAFFTVDEPMASFAFDNIDNKPFLEIRGTKGDGSIGMQTMVPPSVHPSEEIVTLKDGTEIGHVTAAVFYRKAAVYATGCMFLFHLGHRGLIHDVRLALAGFLLGIGFTDDEVINCTEAITEQTGNNVADMTLAARSTIARFRKGEKVAGAGQLLKAIGEEDGKKVLARVREWFGQSDFLQNKQGAIIANSQENIARALEKLSVEVHYNTFADVEMMRLGTGPWRPMQNADYIKLWLDIDQRFGFRPTKDLFFDVVDNIAHHNPKHPVREYLDGLKWDGVERVDQWLIQYAGAADTPYVRAVSRLVLLAAVRRVRRPGCKFDELLVLESGQGKNKSTALRELCPDEAWFSDDLPLDGKGNDSKEVIERTHGKWIVEASELSGMRRDKVEHLKGFLSRPVDGPVRGAYKRKAEAVPRQFIVVGTTNDHAYLHDVTGNRRFWPVRIGDFDAEGVKMDRDQLWAEASHREAAGESIRLSPDLYDHAALQQERRRSEDPWEYTLATKFDEEYQRLAPDEIWEALGIPTERRNEAAMKRVRQILQRTGFRSMTVQNRDGKIVKGWARGEGQRDTSKVSELAQDVFGGENGKLEI